MTGLEVFLLAAVLWLTGVVAILLAETQVPWRELPALALWPVTVPFFAMLRWMKRRQQLCRRCGRRYGVEVIKGHRRAASCTPADDDDDDDDW